MKNLKRILQFAGPRSEFIKKYVILLNLNDSKESRELIVNIILKKQDYTEKTFKNLEYNTNCLARRTKEIIKKGRIKEGKGQKEKTKERMSRI